LTPPPLSHMIKDVELSRERQFEKYFVCEFAF
jgi:hypothetical protein